MKPWFLYIFFSGLIIFLALQIDEANTNIKRLGHRVETLECIHSKQVSNTLCAELNGKGKE